MSWIGSESTWEGNEDARQNHNELRILFLAAFLEGAARGARADLDEAWDIAERGPMRLHLADIHLHRARLFFRERPYPWKSPEADLADANRAILGTT